MNAEKKANLNIPLIKRIIAAISREAETERGIGFNMASWINLSEDSYSEVDKTGASCGTVACIGGWTMVLANDLSDEKIRSGDFGINDTGGFDVAAGILGMNSMDADRLFMGGSYELGDITPTQAIRALNILMETGEVDWTCAIHGPKPTKEIENA